MANIFTLPTVVGKVAQGVANAAANAVKKNTGGGTSSSSNAGGSGTAQQATPSSPAGGYTEKYTGGNAELDAAIKEQSDRYFAAEKAGDAAGMREANDRANQLRNQYGYAAEFADKAINAVAQANRGGSGYSYSGGSGTQGINDYSQYISDMNRAQQESARAQLKAAYDKNIAALNRTAEQIPVEYQNARNQAAAQSDIQAQNFNEYAAARGLNTGAGGQAQLAFRNALQGNLSSLDQAEASSLADLELQRSQAESDYNLAIAQAEANGNYQLAQQLYSEKVRVDEALREQMAWQAQYDFQKLQFDTSNSQWQQQFDASQKASLADQGWNYLSIGQIPPQEVLDAMGIDASSAQNIARYYTSLARAKSTSRSSSNGGAGGNQPDLSTAKRYAENGIFNQDVLDAFYRAGWNDELLAAEYGYQPTVESDVTEGGMNSSYFRAAMTSLAAGLAQGRDTVIPGIDSMWGRLSQQQKEQVQNLLNRYGYRYEEG